jgi:hypothetical protein
MPKFDPKISVGNIVQIAILLVTGGMLWGQVNNRIDSMDRNGTAAMQQYGAQMQKLELAIVKLQTILEERERREHSANQDRRSSGQN